MDLKITNFFSFFPKHLQDFQNVIAIGPETLPEEQLQIQTIRLENLLNDFYAPTSSNERKKEIENELTVFNDVNTYLQLIMYNLDSVSNTYVWYFKASCLEVRKSSRKLSLMDFSNNFFCFCIAEGNNNSNSG